MNKTYYAVFMGKKYRVNIEKIIDFCTSKTQDTKEQEITEAYQLSETDGELELSSKINRELKSVGGSQENVMAYEIIKMLLGRCIDDAYSKDGVSDGVSLPLTFNTLIAYDMITEIEE